MLLAELNIRHTRRHMPTRRIAVDDGYLPTSGPAFGGALIGAVLAECVPGLDEEQIDALARLVDVARRGTLTVPRIALRYRLQRDTHGLDLSRHRITSAAVEAGSLRPVLELDLHGPPAPQVIGALMAGSQLPPSGRSVAFRFVDAALARPGVLPEGLEVRRRYQGLPGMRPPGPGTTTSVGGRGRPDDEWSGVPSERRWAMEVLGLQVGHAIERDDVQRRFRRLIRVAHPDHGGESLGAAERMAELSEARELLLSMVVVSDDDRPSDDAFSGAAGSGTSA
ncbi:MAG TPA: J domain-containing protein [Acidimicrobiia bacterium]|nr:J domain-containing protein [Acidimicrobiia bacterium]